MRVCLFLIRFFRKTICESCFSSNLNRTFISKNVPNDIKYFNNENEFSDYELFKRNNVICMLDLFITLGTADYGAVN
jgi:hypothetical protein